MNKNIVKSIDIDALRRSVPHSPGATKVLPYQWLKFLVEKCEESQSIFNRLMKYSFEFVCYSHRVRRMVFSSRGGECKCHYDKFCARCKEFRKRLGRYVEQLRQVLNRPRLFTEVSPELVARKLVLGKLLFKANA